MKSSVDSFQLSPSRRPPRAVARTPCGCERKRMKICNRIGGAPLFLQEPSGPRDSEAAMDWHFYDLGPPARLI